MSGKGKNASSDLAAGEPVTPLGLYRKHFANVEGFFTEPSILVWDYLLSLQTKWGIKGNFFEIGVYKGKSTFLGAAHLDRAKGESVILSDIAAVTEVVNQINNVYDIEVVPSAIGIRSDNPILKRSCAQLGGTVRWFHVDGDHSGFATYNDLRLADYFLGDRGIICVDDFGNMRYPQLHAAVFEFLSDHKPVYSMLLCGQNKCYITRKCDYRFYEGQIRRELMPFMLQHECRVLLSKSSTIDDGGCFSLLDRFVDRDCLGIDEDIDDLPY